MRYPFLKTEFRENLDKEIIEIISKYWQMENGAFLNSPTELRTKLNITQSKLSIIIKDNSETTLFIEECIDCQNPIEIQITSQSAAKTKIENTLFQCSDCRTRLNQEIKETPTKSRKNHHLEYAIKHRIWNKLTREELAVLKKVIEINDYQILQKQLIQANFQFYWPIIEKLDRLFLIDIQREPINNNINEIYFIPDLATALEIHPRNNVFIESSLNFNLPKKLNNIKETQPSFSKKIQFDKDIVITAGTEYLCSV